MNPKLSEESHSLYNHCNLPPWVIASRGFQEDPSPLELEGVKVTDRRLFERLALLDDPAERGQVFHDYVSVKFRLHEWSEHAGLARSSLRHSYISFLHGWGADNNGHSGAVLKAWVESRFGLKATYHGGRLASDVAAQERYWGDRMKGAARTVAVSMQLDLLYTFCQEELRRRHAGQRWLTLYRGTHDSEAYAVQAGEGGAGGGRTATRVALNNLSSFTSDREIAWEFGSLVWQVRVPLEKIVFFSGLLPSHLLDGEGEYLVLGGEYAVKPLLY
jgi:NAD+--dinitrogen-reductase ADP-D-ribosyltransferase